MNEENTVYLGNVLSVFDGMSCGQRRGRRMEDKCNALQTQTGTKAQDLNWYNGFTYRKLTPLECERLQTLNDNYTEGVSNTQRYKMIGNGWTVEVIAHIFRNIKVAQPLNT